MTVKGAKAGSEPLIELIDTVNWSYVAIAAILGIAVGAAVIWFFTENVAVGDTEP